MPSVHDLWLFILTGLLLNATPGPDIAYIVGRSAQMGVKAGVSAALGIGMGALVHTAAAAVGISAILMTSAVAFTAVKWAGAAYLVHIGVSVAWCVARIVSAGKGIGRIRIWLERALGAMFVVMGARLAVVER